MRKLLVIASFLAAACGGGSSDGGGTTPLSGTVGGRSFSIAEQKAILVSTGATPCSGVPVIGTVGIKGMALQVTSYANACGAYTDTGCTVHQNAQSVTVIFARIVPGSGDVTPIPLATTGKDYTINADATTAVPDGATGYLVAANAIALATDTSAFCVPTQTPPAVQTGTIRFTSVGNPITGHVSVTFANGDKLQGDFSAPPCPGSGPDVCSLVTNQTLCPGTPACVP